MHPAGGRIAATAVPSGLRDRGERGSFWGVAGGNELWADRLSRLYQSAVVFDGGGSRGAREGLPAQAHHAGSVLHILWSAPFADGHGVIPIWMNGLLCGSPRRAIPSVAIT